jgi:hypothetical protein
MNCTRCGGTLADGFAYCPKCGAAVLPTPSPGPVSGAADPFEALVRDVANAADRAGQAAARFSRRAAEKADGALRDPPGTARAVLRRAKQELEQAEKDLENVLKGLD